MKIKLVTGFRAEQFHTIDADEAHKAYYLFANPEERGIFKNGVAVIGRNIQSIVPDYHATMGWNPTHVLDSNDFNELREKGVDVKLRNALSEGKELADFILNENRKDLLSKPLDEAKQLLPAPVQQLNSSTAALANKFKV